MKLDRKLRMGSIGGAPGAFIGEVHRKAPRRDGVQAPVQPPAVNTTRQGALPAARQKGPWRSFSLVLGVAVFLIILSLCAAVVVYFSNPQSTHKEGLQRSLMEALIMTCMTGVGAIFGLLTGIRR
jgi:hypothetical protein